MSTQPPFSWLMQAADKLRAQLPPDLAQAMQPPTWLVHEAQQRMVLFFNHVLMQEPAARDRLQRQKGRSLQVCWRDQLFQCQFTPAGLLELVAPEAAGKPADLVLRISETSPIELAKTLAQGDKPAIRIEGDVQLAAEVNWLFDHVRWEPEEDLARLIGDAPAHTVAQTARKCLDALRSFVKTNFAHKVTPA